MAERLVSFPDDPAGKAQQDFDYFFSRLGYAITRWAHIDRNLFEFCHFALGTSREMTAVVFYRSQTIKDHLMLTDALMGYVLSKPRLMKWKEIFKIIDDLLPFRNDLAHSPPIQAVYMTIVLGGEPKFPVPPPKQEWEIRTEETKLLHKKRKPIQAKKDDIANHIKAVQRLLDEMYAFGKALPKRRRLRLLKSSGPKSLLRLGLENNNSHTRAKPPRRPQSSQV